MGGVMHGLCECNSSGCVEQQGDHGKCLLDKTEQFPFP